MRTTTTRTRSFHCIRLLAFAVFAFSVSGISSPSVRRTMDFDRSWKFQPGDVPGGQEPGFDDSHWRVLDLPHDWSIEGKFSETNPATPGGGALPGGIGWYRKEFSMLAQGKDRLAFIEFDGVYRNSDVWINGHHLGLRPYGYSSFRYELTPFLKSGGATNVVAVRVDNSKQPNSRWYSGSGIYRNVRLITAGAVCVDHWGTSVTTPEVTSRSAQVSMKTKVRNALGQDQQAVVKTVLLDPSGAVVAQAKSGSLIPGNSVSEVAQNFTVNNPILWSIETPRLYRAVTTIENGGRVSDVYETPFGIRTIGFDAEKGFFLNGKPVKIKGVCNHHDLGCFGAAVNTRALERQLEIMKSMGVNGIRTSHNPPAPELLDLCDRMGFVVMDEAFDMWKKKKTDFDYSLSWDEWHQRDLQDMVLRDRNHPSVVIWSIGNEIGEQWDHQDSSGAVIARELASLIRALDTTRPVTSNCNDPSPLNPIIKSGALDVIGFSYAPAEYAQFPKNFPGKKLIGSETTSALATRGHYDMPSDSIRRWPHHWDSTFTDGNRDNTCSSYDNCSVPWGNTNEEGWKSVKKYDYQSGMFIWTGFDYLGEPTPYGWPSRSSYFGIVDLAGFPKDAYYMYQSEWTNTPVLHLFPHWNWRKGETVDVWAYSNCQEVELFLNGQSLGKKAKGVDDLHLMWHVPYAPGTLKAVGRTAGKEILTREIRTAGAPAQIVLKADRKAIAADGKDLSFVTVRVLDDRGTLVPDAGNLVRFSIAGKGKLAAVDNGLQTSMESFQASERRAFNGLCLAVVQSKEQAGAITLKAQSDGLKEASIVITAK